MRTELQTVLSEGLSLRDFYKTKKPSVNVVAFSILFLLFPLVSQGQNSLVPINFTLSTAATTSAGIYKKDSTLVRTLWNNVKYSAGSHTEYWDRKDDDGFMVTDSTFVLTVVSSNTKYVWEGGIIGNTSDSLSGSSKHRYYGRPNNMAITGNTAYFSTGYNEGNSASYKLNTNAPQSRTAILSLPGNIDLWTDFTATDGKNVYWSGIDPYNIYVSLVYASTVSGDKETVFSSGTSISMTYGRTYVSAIDVNTNSVAAKPSGLAVQKTGIYLFVSHKDLNELHVLNKTTGALVQIITISKPRQLCVDMNDNIWIISGNNLVQKFTVNSNGTLSSPILSISNLVDPIALAVSPNNYLVTIIDAGNSQQLKAFSNNNASSVWTLGQAGGYATDPTVKNDKFYFKDTFYQVNFGTFVAFQNDSSFWLGDPGNERIQHFTASRTFIENIMCLPHSYSVEADRNNPTRVFNEFLEFKIDYAKPLAPNNGSWTLVKNWRAGINANYFDPNGAYKIFSNVITMSNGRTYGTLEDNNAGKREIVELPASGNVRYTGIKLESWEDFIIDVNGNLIIMYTGSVQDTMQWTRRKLNGFDNKFNPVWANPITIASSLPTTINDPKPNGQSAPALTTSNRLIVFNPKKNDGFGLRTGYHLGAIKKGTNKWLWKTAKSTDVGYIGPMPADGTFDIGNTVIYPGGQAYAIDNNVFWNYHGEFWKNSQTNIWNHYADNGLMIAQFGITSYDAEKTYGHEAFPMGAGNVFSSVFVKVDSFYYMYHNDESVHGAIHRWKISGLNSVKIQSSNLNISNLAGGLIGSYYDGADLNNLNFKTALLNNTLNIVAPPSQITNANNYSAKWTGFVKPAYSQMYTFYSNTSKGVRLWVNGNLIIDQWNNTSLTQYTSSTMSLIANKRYSIRMDINGGTASLSWSSASQAKQIIPPSALIPSNIPDYSVSYDLLEGLTPNTILQNNLYGWSRNSTVEYNLRSGNIFNVNTGLRSYLKDKTDLYIKFRGDSINRSVTRDLTLPNACLSAWKIKGSLNLEDNYPEVTGEVGGVHIEVLDNTGKIIFRISNEVTIVRNSNLDPMANVRINGVVAVQSRLEKLKPMINKHEPFTVDVSRTGIVFTFSNFAPVTVKFFDTTSKWNKPSSFKISFFKRGSGQNDQVLDFNELRFEPVLNTAVVTASGPTKFCQGSSINLTANNGSSYLWSNNASSKSIAANATGTYSVKVTDAFGCQLNSAPITVTAMPLPDATVSANGPTTFCSGGSVTLNVTTNAAYLWSNNATTKSTSIGNAGTYTVTVTDSIGCKNTSIPSTIKVNIPPVPKITLIRGTTLSSNYSVGNQWYLDAVILTGMVNQTINVTKGGNYSVIVTGANGCTGSDIMLVPLPVSDFTVDVECSEGNQLLFNWKLVNETEASIFYIQYSIDDGSTWNLLSETKGNTNNTDVVSEYSVKTARINNPNCLYKWSRKNLNGDIRGSMILDQVTCGNASKANIFPNPFSSSFNITLPELQQTDDTYEIVIVNAMNQEVVKRSLTNANTSNGQLAYNVDDLNALNNGIYVIRIIHRDKLVYQNKIIKTN